MNILFLTLLNFESLEERNIYTDLLRQFTRNGHRVYAVSPVERRTKESTHLIESTESTILRLQIGNIQKTNLVEKGISTLCIERQFIAGIKKYFSDVRFDLVLYSTPPITFCNAISFVKDRDGAQTYLLLKDIFPQNAVDLGMMKITGPKSILYRMFRKKEQKLYGISDRIGCMSQANVEFLLNHNPEIPAGKVEICPNCIEVRDMSVTPEQRTEIRKKYRIPLDQKVFVYGGNLGKPQGIPFLLRCLEQQKNRKDVYFLVIGDGTEYQTLENALRRENSDSVRLMRRLPKEDYDRLVAACDVGMIFLDHRFTIPNYPSRILAYMQARLPVLVCSDVHTDVGRDAVNGGYGWWCPSDDPDGFGRTLTEALQSDLEEMGANSYEYLNRHFNAESAYRTVERWLGTRNTPQQK